MKRMTIFFILCIFVSVCSIAYAHPPSDIIITFDKNTKVVSAVIKHAVSNPVNHFVKKVDISLNGKEIIEHNINRQENNQTEGVSYRIPDAKEGDIIGVEAYCSISGKLKKEIKMSK